MKRKLRVNYAKKEGKEVPGNMSAARIRLQKKNTRFREKKRGNGIVEGKRAVKEKSGSGFKVSKKRGKMRLVERNS
jgi:hypothetical protein